MEIKIENLTKSFGDKKVFDNFCLTINPAPIVALMAPSGRGKTTLLRLIAGLEKPDSGEITVADRVSFMFQEDRLLPYSTARENIALVSDRKTSDRLLKEVGLENDGDKYPNELSGGMSRRVALARTLAFKSDLILLDEPFKGLDEATKSDIVKLLLKESENRPIILVTHERSEALSLNSEIIEL